MRFYGIALLASAAVLGACGGEKAATDSAAAVTPGVSATTTPDSAAAATPATGTATTAPATGTTHEVKMLGDATGYRFEPANITVKSGDAIKFINVNGGPHNVAFQNVTDATVKAQLDANMPGAKMGELSGPMIITPNEAYTISFGNIPAGKYDYNCLPHVAMNMKGVITVQ